MRERLKMEDEKEKERRVELSGDERIEEREMVFMAGENDDPPILDGH